MAKGGYFHDATGIARKLTKGYYFDANGIARKIKKAYRFDASGIARPNWAGGELAYYGTATALSSARYHLAATTIGNYALFAGGYGSISGVHYTTVDAYDASLTQSAPTVLTNGRYGLAATTVGNYALFGGGLRATSSSDDSDSPTSRVDAYDTSCTKSTPTTLSKGRAFLAATTVGNYALFGGGRDIYNTNLDYESYDIVDAYDTSLTRSIPTALTRSAFAPSAATVGNYALFNANGYINVYDTSLTRSYQSSTIPGKYEGSAATVGNYALFGGGHDNYSNANAIVTAFDASLTRSTPTELSVARSELATTTVGDYALFGGGSAVVDAYDSSLTRSIPTGLSVSRYALAATTTGNYALFGGGMASNFSAVVDVYTVV